ncbi:YeeE/YedE family protein [Aliiglaciecola litoralis]|uniref:Sulphur transport domain-containing protein n=1 Tax=Aliiglaciecola litoralis TaxID=582857 RepID=A0ABN1LSC2_9ALTE
MTEFTPILALLGGGLIGLAALILLLLNGNIAGISGIVSSSIQSLRKGDFWRIVFVIGMMVGCFLSYFLFDYQPPQVPKSSELILIVAGLAVGLGTVIGSGCTSGHGVCGVGRLSIRSIVATIVFLSVGIATATLVGVL